MPTLITEAKDVSKDFYGHCITSYSNAHILTTSMHNKPGLAGYNLYHIWENRKLTKISSEEILYAGTSGDWKWIVYTDNSFIGYYKKQLLPIPSSITNCDFTNLLGTDLVKPVDSKLMVEYLQKLKISLEKTPIKFPYKIYQKDIFYGVYKEETGGDFSTPWWIPSINFFRGESNQQKQEDWSLFTKYIEALQTVLMDGHFVQVMVNGRMLSSGMELSGVKLRVFWHTSLTNKAREMDKFTNTLQYILDETTIIPLAQQFSQFYSRVDNTQIFEGYLSYAHIFQKTDRPSNHEKMIAKQFLDNNGIMV